MTPQTPQTKEEIKKSLRLFNIIAVLLQSSLIFLGAVSVLSTIGVATFSKELEDKGFLKPVAYAAAASSALIMQFSLQRKSSEARRAWRLLRKAIMQHDLSSNRFSDEQLIEAWSEAETIMGDIIFILQSQLGVSDIPLQTPKPFTIEPTAGEVKFLDEIELRISPPQILGLADITIDPPNTGKTAIKSDSVIVYTAPDQAVGQGNMKVKITVTLKDKQVAVSTLEIVA